MTMPADWMPGAVKKPLRYQTPKFTHTPYGWILHVVVGNGSPFKTFNRNVVGKRKNAHGWVSKKGVIEQYVPLSHQSWAQEAGNGDYWAFETEGFPEEALTAEQIKALAKIHNFLGVTDALASKPGQKGIGTHFMGGAAWGGHSCPDPVGKEGTGPRSHQRSAILDAANPPKPVPVPPKGDEPMYQIAKIAGYSATFQSDGKNAWYLPSPAERDAAAYQADKFYGSGVYDDTKKTATVVTYTPDATFTAAKLIRLLMPAGFIGELPPPVKGVPWTLDLHNRLVPPATS